MPAVSVKLPEALSRELAHAAKRRGLPKSEVIRESIEPTLSESREHGQGPSCLDSVAGLVGSFGGCRDASTDRKYLPELSPRSRVMTTDSGFLRYRGNRRQVIPVICPPGLVKKR